MEWYGEKMLPRGLPELVYQVAPYKILANLKVIVYNRRNRPHTTGQVNIQSKVIKLYPTVMFNPLTINANRDRIGVLSFCYWISCLETMLHEIGHIVEYRKYDYITDHMYTNMHRQRNYVEGLANEWKDDMIYKIKRRHFRVGQPEGWIGGLAGIYILRLNKRMQKRRGYYGSVFHLNVAQMRAHRCGGQLTVKDVAKMVDSNKYGEIGRKMRLVKREALYFGHRRHYIDGAGRKHLFFNYSEAVAVAKRVHEVIGKKHGVMPPKAEKKQEHGSTLDFNNDTPF